MTPDHYAAIYAEVKGKVRWAIQTSLPFTLSYSEAMDWAAHYATDVLERMQEMEAKPDFRPYQTSYRPYSANTNGHLTKKSS